MLILDHSASVKQDDFQKQKNFVRGLVSLLPIGKGEANARVGLIRYWHIVELVFDFDDYFNDTAIESVISAMRRPEWHQRTSTGAALQRMVDTFTANNSGARDPSVVPRVAYVLTDGKATDDIKPALQAAQQNSVTIYALGIGTESFSEGSKELKELRKIATTRSNVQVVDFDNLTSVIDDLTDNFRNCGELFRLHATYLLCMKVLHITITVTLMVHIRIYAPE